MYKTGLHLIRHFSSQLKDVKLALSVQASTKG